MTDKWSSVVETDELAISACSDGLMYDMWLTNRGVGVMMCPDEMEGFLEAILEPSNHRKLTVLYNKLTYKKGL